MSAPTSVPAGTPTGEVGFWLECTECAVSGGPYITRAQAGLFASVHDELRHHGHATASVARGGVCESCRRFPGTVTWLCPDAGAPFALCPRCAPDSTTPVGG